MGAIFQQRPSGSAHSRGSPAYRVEVSRSRASAPPTALAARCAGSLSEADEDVDNGTGGNERPGCCDAPRPEERRGGLGAGPRAIRPVIASREPAPPAPVLEEVELREPSLLPGAGSAPARIQLRGTMP